MALLSGISKDKEPIRGGAMDRKSFSISKRRKMALSRRSSPGVVRSALCTASRKYVISSTKAAAASFVDSSSRALVSDEMAMLGAQTHTIDTSGPELAMSKASSASRCCLSRAIRSE
jgi:hypothetical protein